MNTNPEVERRKKWDADSNLRAEFGNSFDRYLAFERAHASGAVRIYSGRTASQPIPPNQKSDAAPSGPAGTEASAQGGGIVVNVTLPAA